MDQTLASIKKLGLGEKETSVYMAALELGNATMQELAEKSGVKRTSIYNFLDKMKQKKLLFEIKKDGKVFIQAGSPEVLITQAEDNLKNLKDIVPFLSELYRQPTNKPKVKFFLGTDSLKNLYKEIWSRKEPIYGYSDFEKMLETMDAKYMWDFADLRARLGIPFYCIAKDDPMARHVQTKDKEQKRVIKLVKGGAFETEINIYGKWVAIASFRRPYVGVIIEDVAIARTMKAVWQMLWDKLD